MSRFLLPMVALLFLASASLSQAEDNVHKVSRGPFRIEVHLDGILDSTEKAPIAVRTKLASDLLVDEAVAHGHRVKEGTVILRLDTTKIDAAIEELEANQELAELSLEQAEASVEMLEQSTPLKMEAAERTAHVAHEDLEYFRETGRAENEKSIEHGVRQSRLGLTYRMEELSQLLKMYEEDELTEESEEIVLQRARNDVESSRFGLHRAELAREKAFKFTLPRQEAALESAHDEAQRALAEAKATLPAAMKKAHLDLEKLHFSHERAEEKLERMHDDRELMVVHAPIDGIVYYGHFTDGSLPSALAAADSLQPGAKLKANQIVMTVVDADSLVMSASVTEAQLALVRAGSKGTITAVRFPGDVISGWLKSVSSVPVAPGKFSATIGLNLERDSQQLVPGLGCRVNFVIFDKKNAMTVPESAVRTSDNGDGDSVRVKVSGGTDTREVRVGRRHDGRVEILDGLEVGESVLTN